MMMIGSRNDDDDTVESSKQVLDEELINGGASLGQTSPGLTLEELNINNISMEDLEAQGEVRVMWEEERKDCQQMLLRAVARKEIGLLEHSLRVAESTGMHNAFEALDARVLLNRLVSEEVGIAGSVADLICVLDGCTAHGSEPVINKRAVKTAVKVCVRAGVNSEGVRKIAKRFLVKTVTAATYLTTPPALLSVQAQVARAEVAAKYSALKAAASKVFGVLGSRVLGSRV